MSLTADKLRDLIADLVQQLVEESGVAIAQYTTMPTITAELLGQVAQYVGETDATYTFGHFYAAVSDGEPTPTYSWSEIVYGDPNSVSYSAQTGKTEAEKAQARENIGAEAKYELLWENADPTANFAGQKIYIDLTDFNKVGIVMTATNAALLPMPMYIFTIGDQRLTYACLTRNYYRYAAYMDSAGITFADGYVVNTYGSAAAVDNTRMIPLQIYGIR